MVLADSNIWLALSLSKHQFHEACRSWITSLESSERVMLLPSHPTVFLKVNDYPISTGSVWYAAHG